jgi:hypothetical protein
MLRREFNHCPIFGRITERRENFAAHPKIGMIHVRGLNCLGKAEREMPKIFCINHEGTPMDTNSQDDPLPFQFAVLKIKDKANT